MRFDRRHRGRRQDDGASDSRIAGFTSGADNLGDIIMNTGFSQPQEEEADQEGVKYVIACGYNPDGYLHFLQRMQSQQGSGGHPFGTHPGIGDRVKSRLRSNQQERKIRARGGAGGSIPG